MDLGLRSNGYFFVNKREKKNWQHVFKRSVKWRIKNAKENLIPWLTLDIPTHFTSMPGCDVYLNL